MGVLLAEGHGPCLGTGILGKVVIRAFVFRLVGLVAPDAFFMHRQRGISIFRDDRLVVGALDGDGDDLFTPRAPIIHDADHKGLGHGLAFTQLRDGIVLLEFVGIVPVLVQGQGAVGRGGDIAAVTMRGDPHSTASQTMAAAILPHRGGGQPFGIAIWLQGELQAVVFVVCGRYARAVFTVSVRGLHTAVECGHGNIFTGRTVGMQTVISALYLIMVGIIEGLFSRDF